MDTAPAPSSEKVKIVVVDDHTMFSEGLMRMFGDDPVVLCVGHFRSARSALSALRGGSVDVVLLDVDLGAERAIDLVLAAKEAEISSKILVLTAGCTGQQAIQLVRNGVAGIMHKHQPVDILREAILKVASGGVFLEDEYLGPVLRSMDKTSRDGEARLNERELILTRSVLQGLTNKEIAGILGISEGAVKASLHQFFQKLGVRTRAQMVKIALERFRDQLQ